MPSPVALLGSRVRCPLSLRLLGRPFEHLRSGQYTRPEKCCINGPQELRGRHRQCALPNRLVVRRFVYRSCALTGQTWRLLSASAATTEHTSSGAEKSPSLASRGMTWLAECRRRLASRLHHVQKEDWVLLCISLGWGAVLGGAVLFKAWRSATRESRHPYLQEAKSMLQSDVAVVDYLGLPLEVTAVEEHNETFAPWKRLVLQLHGPKGCTHAFVCARRTGYSEQDLVEKFSEDEEGALWNRPYVLKQWLLQLVSDAWELFQLLCSSTGTEGMGRSDGIGQWEVTSLFVLAPQDPVKECGDTEIQTPRVIASKGSPADNPDWCKTANPINSRIISNS